ncbi:MTOR-associated protein MEAK7 isoform X2 [Panthera tigris]|uniref:MTOR-associated protein MEAK7 isoform X2 n=1 Tax=Panthera tigris TaxID=9694 RepID=UPI001C6FA02E|nr:MTOR-associated protein MEAK7 isoform X2 [Panthera tigris]XP_042824069.1 MTOR-associated protein MEAK7 isoform X2 [Panthera tigris]XP_042824070.1 MTOR-associated protein MEAK7 isoform X2 [Panthera tigris]XP_042824072.1 MTOR-associated protein MEAK7 isoform X2 [Panthera tigris]XP_042824073.1 MTOR-associated protein MEAK7 isoform X2 [Panthera tigris]
MGNSRSQSGPRFCSQFLPEEQAEIDGLFDALSSEKQRPDTSPRSFSLKALKSHLGEALPPEMVTRLYDGMRSLDLPGKAKGPSESVSREQFTMFVSHLLKGSSEEKSLVIVKMISATEGPVKAREVQEFTEDLVGSVVHVLNYRQELRGWTQKRGPGPPPGVQVLAAQLFSEMELRGGEELPGPQQLDRDCDRAVIEDWVFRAPHVATFLSVVVHRGFLLPRLSLDLAPLVPERHVDQERVFESILDVPSVIYVNAHLPREQRHRWHLLFSSELHGHSFAQLCGRITHQGPCVLLLEDRDGHVFGGFASCSWEVKPQFQGDDRCFLFSTSPRMAVYTSTGYNDHYMYLNHGQQTIPNGLGMGGQHNYFGLWVDVDFGKGHSKAKPKCTTYHSPQLSAQEDFRFEKMEVWALSEAPGSQQAQRNRSILAVDPEAQALLEIMGRPRHSQGLQDAPEDE